MLNIPIYTYRPAILSCWISLYLYILPSHTIMLNVPVFIHITQPYYHAECPCIYTYRPVILSCWISLYLYILPSHNIMLNVPVFIHIAQPYYHGEYPCIYTYRPAILSCWMSLYLYILPSHNIMLNVPVFIHIGIPNTIYNESTHWLSHTVMIDGILLLWTQNMTSQCLLTLLVSSFNLHHYNELWYL